MRLNTPNKLTVLRIVLSPLFLIVLIADFPHHLAPALLLFIAAALTDLFDGRVARSRGLVTDFGKFLDPIADKLLTAAAYLGFIQMGFGTGVVFVTMIVLLREFLIASFRMAAADKGTVIAANIYGKIKTVTQVVAIISVIFFEYLISLPFTPHFLAQPLRVAYSVFLWISAAAALLSGVTYLFENRGFLKFDK